MMSSMGGCVRKDYTLYKQTCTGSHFKPDYNIIKNLSMTIEIQFQP